MPIRRSFSGAILVLALSLMLGCASDSPTDAEQVSLDEASLILHGTSAARDPLARPQTWVDGELFDGVVTPSVPNGAVSELYVTDAGFAQGASQIAGTKPGEPGYRGGRWHVNRLKSNVSPTKYASANSLDDLNLNDFEVTEEHIRCPLLPRRGKGHKTHALTVPGDYPTIQAAVDAAVDGDEIVVSPGTYYEAVVVPQMALTIRSKSDDPDDTILNGSQNDDDTPMVDFIGEATGTLTLRGFTLTESHNRAVAVFNPSTGGHYAFENCRFVENGPYGALRCTAASIAVEDCHFIDNDGYGFGAGILMDGDARIVRSVFINNDAIPFQVITLTQGGAIHCVNAEGREGSTLTVDDCTFEGNHCTDYGGAIHISSNHKGSVRNSRFMGNSADACAGSIYVIANDRRVVLERNLHVGESSPRAAAVGIHFGSNNIVRNNTIVFSKRGEGIRLEDSNNNTVENNVVAFGDSRGIRSIRAGTILSCNNSFGNPMGNYNNDAEPPANNLSKDPRFCDPSNLLFTVSSDSPCLPANNDCGVLIGVYGQGCTAPVSAALKRGGPVVDR
jgi:parallel beta-helix repeat protein/predicted outer membrane repeat protein